jgi:hypothetical protein
MYFLVLIVFLDWLRPIAKDEKFSNVLEIVKQKSCGYTVSDKIKITYGFDSRVILAIFS